MMKNNMSESLTLQDQVFFSIVVPVHNAVNTLEYCVNSVLNQQYDRWELLLVENGSKDDSLALCRAFEEKDSRIRVFTTQTGPSEARNCGIDKARGSYLLFLDSDDALCGELAALAEKLKGNCDLCFLTHNNASQNGQIVSSFYAAQVDRLTHVSGRAAYQYLYGELHIATSSCVYAYHKAFLDEQKIRFAQDLYIGEDMHFATRALWLAQCVEMLPEPMLRFTLNDGGSLTTSMNAASCKNLKKAMLRGIRFASDLEEHDSAVFLEPYQNSGLWMLYVYGGMSKCEQDCCKEEMRWICGIMQHSTKVRFWLPAVIAEVFGVRLTAKMARLMKSLIYTVSARRKRFLDLVQSSES